MFPSLGVTITSIITLSACSAGAHNAGALDLQQTVRPQHPHPCSATTLLRLTPVITPLIFYVLSSLFLHLQLVNTMLVHWISNKLCSRSTPLQERLKILMDSAPPASFPAPASATAAAPVAAAPASSVASAAMNVGMLLTAAGADAVDEISVFVTDSDAAPIAALVPVTAAASSAVAAAAAAGGSVSTSRPLPLASYGFLVSTVLKMVPPKVGFTGRDKGGFHRVGYRWDQGGILHYVFLRGQCFVPNLNCKLRLLGTHGA